MVKLISKRNIGSGVMLFPAIFFGKSDRCWWVYITFNYTLGVMVYP
jgi:hypothetical protein